MGIDPHHSHWSVGFYAGAGLVYGLFNFFLVAGLSGAGHGWGSAVISGLAIFVAPLAGIGIALRHRMKGKAILSVAMIAAVGIDIGLYFATLREGTGYFKRAMSDEFGLTWLALWCGWQLIALGVLMVAIVCLKQKEHAADR